MKAVHLICRRKDIGFEGLTPVEGKRGYFHSCCWAFRESDNPRSLVGGWVYLHPISKGSPSEFGGIVRDVLPATRGNVLLRQFPALICLGPNLLGCLS